MKHPDKIRVLETVNVVFLDGDKVLLQKRKNSGWMDGWYDLPGGHLEPDENFLQAAVREAKEEVGLTVLEEDLELFHICQNMTEVPYTYLNFKASKWQGTPHTLDPEFVEEIDFFPLSTLPQKTIKYIRVALAQLDNPKVSFAYMQAKDNDI